jgi:type I restriction enzyme R subunit
MVGDFRDYSKQKLTEQFSSLKDFLTRWTASERKEKLLEELAAQGIPLEQLQNLVPNGEQLDIFDLIAHIAFDQKPLTRSERVKRVKAQNYFAQYDEKARAVLDALLEKYAQQGIRSIENPTVLELPPFDQFGSKTQIRRNIFGSVENYSKALTELENALYSYNEQASS